MMAQHWGQLVSVTDLVSDPVLLEKDSVIIGRSKDADVSFPSNIYISSKHCRILRDRDGIVWLEDVSTNGTLLNHTQKLHKQITRLEHGDEFMLVFKKTDDSNNLGYIFQDAQKLAQEHSSSSEGTLEYTLAQSFDADDEVTGDAAAQREVLSASVHTAAATGSNVNTPNIQATPNSTQETQQSKSNNEEANDTSDNGRRVNIDENDAATLNVVIATTATDSLVAARVGAPAEAGSSAGTSHIITSAASGSKADVSSGDAFQEHLICMICQEVLHNCVSLQPCLHCFCAGCYSDWMGRSNSCPSCRGKVEFISKNHLINNLVEAYLTEHPDKRRSDEELKQLDDKNKITSDILKQPRKRRHSANEDGSYEGSNNSDYSGSDSDDSSEPHQLPLLQLQPPQLLNPFSSLKGPVNYLHNAANAFRVALFGAPAPPPLLCRMCDAIPAPGAAGMTAAGYACRPGAPHLLCLCCSEPMPDRRADRAQDNTIPAQQCTLCNRYFCHQYWGCRKPGCLGCLQKFKDCKFDIACLAVLILDNSYESDILKVYLQSQNITILDLLATCCQKLDSGEYKLTGQYANVTTDTMVCYSCGLLIFKQLAYQYRTALPAADLPAAARGRVDCYWGRYCRTQSGKPQHAAKFNHVCEQTRQT